MDLPDSDRGDFSCRRAVDSSSLKNENHKNKFFCQKSPDPLLMVSRKHTDTHICSVDSRIEMIL